MTRVTPQLTARVLSVEPPNAQPPVGLILGATIASGLLNYTYTLWLTALLPAKSYSEFSSSLALLLVVGTVANAAVPWVLAQELRRSADAVDRRRAFSAGLALNVILGITAAGTCALLASRFLVGWSIVAVAAAAFGFFVASSGMGWALGRSHFGALATMVAGEVGIKVVAGIVLVNLGAGMFGAVGAAAVGTAAVIVFTATIMGADRRLIRPGRHFSRMLQSSAGLSALQGVLVAAAVLDVVLIEVTLRGGPLVAAYQLAATLGRAPIFLAMAIAMMVYPTVAGDIANREADGHRVFQGLSLLLTMSLFSWAVLATIPRSVILMVAPATYEVALRFLPVTAASGLVWSLVIYLSCSLGASGRFRSAFVPVVVNAALGGVAMATVGHSTGVWGFAIIELLTAGSALVCVAYVSLRHWGLDHLKCVVKGVPWILAILPLFFLRAEPAIWTCVVALLGATCLIVSFPPLRSRLFLR